MNLTKLIKSKQSVALLSSLILGIYFYITPYLSILRFKSSLENLDYIETNKFINYLSLRESIKSQIKVALTLKAEEKVSDKSILKIGILFMNPLINKIVDTTVSPSGLKALLETGRTQNLTFTKEYSKDKETKIATSKRQLLHTNYSGINEFVLTKELTAKNDKIKFVWKRDGLIHWRLNSIDLPRNLLEVEFF